MKLVGRIWRDITQTKALDNSSGAFETRFFEALYRVTYFAGLSSVDRTVLYLLYSTFVKVLIAIVLVGEVWYAYADTRNIDEVVGCVNVIVIQLITIYKFKNLVDHKEIYKRLSTSMESPYFDTSTDERKRLVKFWAKTHESYLKLLLGLGNCSLAAWHLYPLVDEVEYNLMIGVKLPFEYNTTLKYPLTYLFVGIAFQYTAHFVMVTDLIMQAHLVPLICEMTVLADCFRNIIQDSKEEMAATDMHINELILNKEFQNKYLKKLGNCVKQHRIIMKNTMDLRAILSGPMLGQMAASGTLICFIGYQATAAGMDNLIKATMSMFYLGYNMFGLFILCRWCEEITVQSQNIGEAAYASGWETGTSTIPGVRSTILFVIARANTPLVITAGGMYNLSLKSYTTLVKTSYSALTVLLRFRHE